MHVCMSLVTVIFYAFTMVNVCIADFIEPMHLEVQETFFNDRCMFLEGSQTHTYIHMINWCHHDRLCCIFVFITHARFVFSSCKCFVRLLHRECV